MRRYLLVHPDPTLTFDQKKKLAAEVIDGRAFASGTLRQDLVDWLEQLDITFNPSWDKATLRRWLIREASRILIPD